MNGGDDDVMTLSEERVLLLEDGKEEDAAVVAGQKNCGRAKILGPRPDAATMERARTL